MKQTSARWIFQKGFDQKTIVIAFAGIVFSLAGLLAAFSALGLVGVDSVEAATSNQPVASQQVAAPPQAELEAVVQTQAELQTALSPAELDAITVNNLRVARNKTNNRVVLASLSNQSSTSVTDIHIEVKFLDHEGKQLFQRVVNPLAVGTIFGDRVDPLPPTKNRPFKVSTDLVPSSWAGKVQAQVTHLRLGG
ncbi:MAG: DUF3157 family protein [Magnetococcales bacterium]|nr:DUF3157 family protein [Magnetococcales bacterium]